MKELAALEEKSEVRLRLFSYFGIALFLVVFLRLWYLQVMMGDDFAGISEQNRIKTVSIRAMRGNIYDRYGNTLVANRPSVAVTAVPAIVLKNENEMIILSDLLDIPFDEIKGKLEKGLVHPLDGIILKNSIDDETAAEIADRKVNLPGVTIEPEIFRFYPNGSLAAHILGYIGPISDEQLADPKMSGKYVSGDVIGKSGLEMYYESYLRGQPGYYTIEVNPAGYPIRNIDKVDSIPGNNIHTTLDLDMQRYVEERLAIGIEDIRGKIDEKTKEPFKATGGAAVVLDATNGEILAMASYPSYDPSLFVEGISQKNWDMLNDPENNYPLNNRVIMPYAPASTFKVVTLLTSLMYGIIDETGVVICRGVWDGLGKGYEKYCWNRVGHGAVDVLRSLEQSCDIFYYTMGLEIYRKRGEEGEILQKVARMLGFGTPTGVDLPFESSGRVPDLKWKKKFNKQNSQNALWYAGDTVNIAIGQGDLLATPLQVAELYLQIANRGEKFQPHFLSWIESYDGKVVKYYEPVMNRPVDIDVNLFETEVKGLARVTVNGTAMEAFAGFPLDQHPVAAKTGTSEVLGKQNFSWIASFSPVQEPKYVVVVMVEEGGSGGGVAAKIARQIYDYLYKINL